MDYYQKNIFARCKLLRPAYTPIIGIETYQDKQFIVIWCPGGDNRPYSSPKTMEKDNKERVHYIRKASNTVEPSDDEEKDLFNLANRVPFDDRVNHQAEHCRLKYYRAEKPRRTGTFLSRKRRLRKAD